MKYLLDDLSIVADLALVNCICFGGVENLVYFVQALEDRGQGQVASLFALATLKLASKFTELLCLEEPWLALHANPDLQKLVIELGMPGYASDGQIAAKYFADRTGRPWSDFGAPAGRCKWYIKTWAPKFDLF